MSINIISKVDGVVINETLKDEITIYEYINKIIDLLGDDVEIEMVITTNKQVIRIKIK